MSKILKRCLYPLAVFLFLGVVKLHTFAGVETGPVDSGEALKLKNPLGTENIIDVINSVLNYLIYISVPILAFFILWGGFQILTARDDPEKVKNGRKTIQWAVLGFAIILISKGVALILLTILKG